jgi:hypothetical protein
MRDLDLLDDKNQPRNTLGGAISVHLSERLPAHHRDLTDAQWSTLDTLIPEPAPIEMGGVVHGRIDVPS